MTTRGLPNFSEELERKEEELSRLRKKLAAQREETKIEQKNNEHLRSELARLNVELSKKAAPSVESRSAMDQQLQRHSAEIRELKEAHDKELASLKRSHQTAITTKETGLKAQLAELRGKLNASHDEIEKRHEEKLESLRETLRKTEERALSERSGKIHELEAKIAGLEADKRTQAKELESLRASATERDTSQHAPAEKDASPPPPTSGRADDLTALKGIGPAFAKSLAAAGISSFSQIAAWTDEDIEAIAPKIKTTPARIKKNDWVGSAQKKLA